MTLCYCFHLVLRRESKGPQQREGAKGFQGPGFTAGERASIACSGHRLQSFQSLYWTRVLVTCSSLQSQLTSHPGSILSSCPNLGLCSWPPPWPCPLLLSALVLECSKVLGIPLHPVPQLECHIFGKATHPPCVLFSSHGP